MKESKVCVVIPVYKGKGVVDKCITALMLGTHKPDKIVCVDDASPDGSADYIRKKFPFVEVIRNISNIGASGTYAKGIKYAYEQGFEWIWLLDQDDVPFKDALENLLKFYQKQRKIILTSALIDPFTHFVYPMLSRGNICSNINFYEAEVVNFAGMLLHRKVIEEVGYPLKILTMDAADWEYCLRCKKLSWKIYVILESKVYHIAGNPKVVSLPIARTYYKLDDFHNLRKIFSKDWLVRSDPSSRYHTLIKNTIFVMNLPYATAFFKQFCIKLLMKHFLKILVFEDSNKVIKLKAFFSGLVDALVELVDFC